MIANMKMNNGKCLAAAVAILAMIACCLAIAVPSDAVDGTPGTVQADGSVTVDNFADIQTVLNGIDGETDTSITTMRATANITINAAVDLKGLTLDMGSNILTISGAAVTNGTITGTYGHTYTIGMQGTSSLANVNVEMYANENGMVNFAAIIPMSDATVTITGGTISSDLIGGTSTYGAIQVALNNTSTTLDGVTIIGNGLVTMMGQKLTIIDMQDVLLQYVGAVTISSETLVLTDSTIGQTVFGWDDGNSARNSPVTTPVEVSVNITEDIDLGTIREGDDPNSTINSAITVGDSITTTMSGSIEGLELTANGTINVPAGKTLDLSSATVKATDSTLIAGAGSSVVLPAETSGFTYQRVDNTGSIVVGDSPVEDIGTASIGEITDQSDFESALAMGYPTISLGSELAISSNVTVDYPLVLTGDIELANGVEISFTNGGSYNGKVTGTDASSETSDVTVNLSGTFTLKAGSVELIDFNGSNPNTDYITTVGGSDFVLTGSLNSKLTVNLGGSGKVTLKDLNITSNGSIYFVENSGYSGSVTSEGTVSVYGKIMAAAGSGNTAFDGVSITVQSGATFRAYGGSVLQDTVTVEGADDKAIINLDGAMHTVTMNDDLNSSNTYGQTQTVVIGSTLDIVSGTKITILGQFVVNEGVTLTIQDGATLEIAGVSSVMDVNGNIIIEDGGKLIVSGGEAVDISGNVDIYGEMSVTSGKVTVQENGKVTVAVDGNIVVSAGTTVKSGATVDILGGFDIKAITNEGTINLTGAVKNGTEPSTITLGNGGVVNVNSYTVSEDAGNKVMAIRDADGNAVTFTVDAAKTGFSGAVISSASEKVDGKDVYTMSVSGSIGAVEDTADTGTYTVAVSGNKVVVADSLTVGKNVTVNNSAKLAVSGTITATDGTFENAGILDVTGTVTVSGSNTALNGTVNAAYYSLTPAAGTTATTVYTTFENAVQSGATRVTVGNGNSSVVTVAGDVTVPATVTMVTVNGILNIGAADNRDITVTVSNGSNVTGNTIEVYATLVFENNRNDRTQVNSDVVINADPARTYTNIYTALASGAETVTVARNVTLTSNVEVPAGVTLVVPAGTGLTFNAGVTMTVNGAVQTAVNLAGATVDGATVTFTDKTATVRDNTAKIVVNGTFMSSVTGKTPAALYQDYRIPGAYYNVSDSTGAYVVVQPVASAAANAANAVGGIIGVYGENTVADVAFTGTEQQTVEVTVTDGAKLTAGTVTLSYARLVATGQIDGTVATAVGSIDVVNTKGITVADVFTEVDGADVESMTVAGNMDKADAEGANASVTVASGNVTVTGELTSETTAGANGTTDNVALTVASGATLAVKGTVEYTAFTVNGTLVSTDGGNVEVATMYVFGTLTVEESTSETGAGSATVTTLYVGLDNEYDNITAAAVNGNVTVSTLMVVSSSSTVEADLLETFSYDTGFNVEGTVWFTAYAKSTSTPVTVDDVAVENADFLGWAEKENGDVIPEGTGDNAPAKVQFFVGQYETLYAVIDYNIYTVTVIADNGIGTVAIDGQVLVKNGNQFTISGLKAGTHTIEYSFNSGFGGSPAVTMNGQQLSGSFTLSGTTSADRNVTISIYGSEAVAQEVPAATDSGDNGLTLTDYLLIILVILIVIMAIMVAFRLMRS